MDIQFLHGVAAVLIIGTIILIVATEFIKRKKIKIK